MKEGEARRPETGTEGLLFSHKAIGIDYLVAIARADFPPIIEALAGLPADTSPSPVTVPHETAGVAVSDAH